jgi:L-2,4-diaminobutyrate transaminase
MFGSPHYGITPDIMTIAKGLTSAYAPLSGSIVSDGVWDVLGAARMRTARIGHGWTYSAHPIGAAAGVANLKLLDSLNLVANAGDVGPYLTRTMAEAVSEHANVGEVRGEGMLTAVELVKNRDTREPFDPADKVVPRIAEAMGRRGVIARAMPQGDILGYAPPLSLSKAEADTIVTVTAEAIAEVLG